MHDNPSKIVRSHLASWQIVWELPIVKRKALWLLLITAPLSTILLIIIPEGYGDIALFVLVLCLVPMELSVNLLASDLVVPILIATQGIHHGTYIVSHMVGHNTAWLLQANRVLPPLEGPFLYTKCLGEIVLDFCLIITFYSIAIEKPLFYGLYLIIVNYYKAIIVPNHSLSPAHPIAVV